MPSYRDLDVYQEGYALALEMHRLTLGFPDDEGAVVLGAIERKVANGGRLF